MEILLFPSCLLLRISAPRRLAFNRCASVLMLGLLVFCAPWIPHLCLSRLLWHTPCPGCGITTGVREIARFHWAAAWQSNPASFPVSAGLLLQATSGLAELARPHWRAQGLGFVRSWMSGGAYSALLLIWTIRWFGRHY